MVQAGHYPVRFAAEPQHRDAIVDERVRKKFAEGQAGLIAWYIRIAAPRSGFLSKVRS